VECTKLACYSVAPLLGGLLESILKRQLSQIPTSLFF